MNRDQLPRKAALLMRNSRPLRSVEFAVTSGRSVNNGHYRGWGLQYGNLSDAVLRNSAFQKAFKAARTLPHFSILPKVRLENLFLIVTQNLRAFSDRDVIEFGAYRGGTTIFLASLLKDMAPHATVFALDTFSGVPAASEALDLHREADFADTDLAALRQHCCELGLDNVRFLQGRFQDTYPRNLAGRRRFGLVHIDCDTYESVSFAWRAVWSDMCEGGYLIFDDADGSSCLGATQAMEEMVMEKRLHSEQAWPHFVFRKAELSDPENMSLGAVLKTRRQCRRFTTDTIPSDDLSALLETMHGAPSVGNSKPWRVVQIGSTAGLTRLKECFERADRDTRDAVGTERAAAYGALEVSGFLDAPVQLAIFTDMAPQEGHRQGSATFPEALIQSTVGAIHTLWLAAVARGLGFSWSSTFHASDMEKCFARDEHWAFTGHVAIGWPAEKLDEPRHDKCGFQPAPPLRLYEA